MTEAEQVQAAFEAHRDGVDAACRLALHAYCDAHGLVTVDAVLSGLASAAVYVMTQQGRGSLADIEGHCAAIGPAMLAAAHERLDALDHIRALAALPSSTTKQ